jgi:oligoendopeptidase F
VTPENCDDEWERLEDRFRPYLCWDGYREYKRCGWQKKDHIFQAPFYYIEYGMALIGAIQLWMHAKKDLQKTANDFQSALTLGASVSLPALYQTAGIQFRFDEEILGKITAAMMQEIQTLRTI